MTKEPEGDEDYADFITRASRDPIGRLVKLADLHDNCDLARIADPSQQDHDRIAKYRLAIAQLDATVTQTTGPSE